LIICQKNLIIEKITRRKGSNGMAKVYIFLAEGFEEIEALTVVDILRRAEIDITMVSITGSQQVTGSHNIATIADILFEECDYSDADMLVLPGGLPGTNHLMEHPGMDQLLKKFAAEEKKLAAICAAPKVLGTKGILQGKKATCYPGHEDSLLGAYIMSAAVVEDGNITTSRGMGTSIDFSLALVKIFQGAEESERIARAIQYSTH
jgi:4-methyl-5(b-hydroxyethyl)-thiazole monophosphate biosynthesis